MVFVGMLVRFNFLVTFRQGAPWEIRDENGQYIQPQEKNADYKGRQIRDEFLHPVRASHYLGSAGSAENYYKKMLYSQLNQ